MDWQMIARQQARCVGWYIKTYSSKPGRCCFWEIAKMMSETVGNNCGNCEPFSVQKAEALE